MGRKSIAVEDPIAVMDTIRLRTLRLFKSVVGNVSKLNGDADVSTLYVMKEELTSKWSDYMRAFEEHESALSSMASPDLNSVSQEFIEQHNKYVQAKITIARLLEQAPSTNSRPLAAPATSAPIIAPSFKMPPIRITPFDGSLCDWIEFKATCESVLKDHIPDVHRLQCLKDALVGEPRTLVSHILPAEGAYHQAMTLLKSRYENTRAIINESLRKLYAIPLMSTSNATALRSMLNTVNGLLASLHSCNIDTRSWNSILIFHLSQRFDKTTIEQWEEKLNGKRSIPEWKAFVEFLEVRITVCETTENFSTVEPIERQTKVNFKQPNPKQNFDQKRPIERVKAFYTIKSDYKCALCGRNHLPSRCDELGKMSAKNRIAVVRKNNLCDNCFYPHHVRECPFLPACRHCSQPHNTLLHIDERHMFLNQVERNESDEPNDCQKIETLCDENEDLLSRLSDAYFYHVSESDTESALLSTAMIPVRSNGRSALLRAFIDGGSTGNLITVNACRLLQLKYPRLNMLMTGVGGSPVGNVLGRVMIDIGSIHNENFSLIIRAIVVKSIGSVNGFNQEERSAWHHLNGLNLADPTYYEPGEIDILLGTIAHADIALPGLLKGTREQPIAQQTELGWLISGRRSVSNKLAMVCHNVNISECNDADLNHQLKAFWEIEEVTNAKLLTTEEQLAEDVFKKTINRADDGKLIVDLPFQMDPETHLGQSREIAEKQYRALQRRLEKNPKLKQNYDAVFEEYLSLKHMQLVEDSPHFQAFIPHHPVIKETSTTTKVRNVFNASMKTSNGVSLNDCLCVGPTIQPELFDQLIQWRKFKFVLSGDIEKMYRQIWINPQHANHQTILWQRPGTHTIREYRLMTVTFGTSSAPFQAIRSLHEVGERVKHINCELAETIQRNFYVDDFMKSFCKIKDAIQLRKSLTETLSQYGMPLRKWKTNDQRLLADVNETECEKGLDFDSTFKTLGIAWKADFDAFVFTTLKLERPKMWTKRSVLSIIAKIFDPLGWLAPIIVRAKLLMQDIWRIPNGTTWDDEIPAHIMTKWNALFAELTAPIPITIPRWLHFENANEQIEIHIFCDASNAAYVAGVYARVIKSDGTTTCNLIAAKTKVAPTKLMTIPRLELCGALLGANLGARCLKALNLTPTKIIAWCDSKVVLAWLATHPSKWTPFVANRVSAIQEIISTKHWMYISSKLNPADIASRGTSIRELHTCQLWWHGPKFLTSTEYPCPEQQFTLPIEQAPEKRKNVKICHVAIPQCNYTFERFSDYTRLLRFACYAWRWLKKAKTKRMLIEPINALELDAAETRLIRLVQQEHFGHEIGRLKEKRVLPNHSKILTLTPFLDDKGMLRMNGRVGNAEFLEQKYSLILPAHSKFVTLLIQHFHEQQELHGGVQKTLRALRERFWILRSRAQVQKIINRCMVCYRTKKVLLKQRMADLPSFRTRQAKPFTVVGTDYAGYFEIKTSERKNAPTAKAYIALFMCLTTKALHLEVACDLSSAEFIMALENFIARRGIPTEIWSDNATNYIGAEKEIHELHNQWLSQTNELTRLLASKRITFKHIPARASHMAGIWERAVGQVKYHLKRVLKDTKLTARRFDYVLKQIECCLNSRPLWALTPNADDIEVLTPSHFFNFEPINTLPRPDITHIPINRLCQYQYLYRLYTEFWKGWAKEYIDQLQPREKWNQAEPNVHIGQVVVISDDNVPPSKWPLGKIIGVHPGKDNLIRTVEVLCKGRTLTRPIHRLGILPILDNKELNHSGDEQLNGREDVVQN